MEKVKLTPKQAESLEYLKRNFRFKEIVTLHVQKYGCDWVGKGEGINGLDVDTLIKALYIGYEIEEPFKVGDWVKIVYDNKTMYGQIDTLAFDDVIANFSDGKRRRVHYSEVECMTPEEIVAEKERRKWAAIGRKVGEYRKGDLVERKSGGLDEVEFTDIKLGIFLKHTPCYHSPDEIVLICPVERRFDVKGDDDESA